MSRTTLEFCLYFLPCLEESFQQIDASQSLTSLTEPFGAVRTCKRLLLIMESLMSNKITVPYVTFSTLGTSMGLGSSMDMKMAS